MKIQTTLAIAIGVFALVLAFRFFDTFAVMMVCIGALAIISLWGSEMKKQEESDRVWNAIEDLNRRLEAK